MEYRAETNIRRRSYLKLFAYAAVGIIALLLFANLVYIGFSERTTQLSAYSDKWNDLSDFRVDLEKSGFQTASIISSPTMLSEVEEPEKALFVAVGIERAYSTTEASAIYDFIRLGGNAIIADDYGFANSLSEYYFDVSFINHRLWDQHFEKNPQLVKIDVAPERDGRFYFDGNIVLNNPTAMVSPTGAFVSSTNLSWVDRNNDNVQNVEELSQSYPVVVKKEFDPGAIVFISDSSLFINDMYEREWESFDNTNSDFIMALVNYLLDAGGTVIFDESRHIKENLVESGRQAVYEALVILTTDDQLRWLTAIITILVLGLLIIGYDNPRELWHEFNLGSFKLTELRNPWLDPADTERMRYIFLERVRIHLGLSLEEFRDLTRDELEELIGDRYLASFALDLKRSYSGHDLTNILHRIQTWPMSIPPEDSGYS